MNAAISAAKKKQVETSEFVSNNGVKLRVCPVSQILIEEAVRGVSRPRVPMVMDENKGYEEENPNDPNYLIDLENYERKQGRAAIDAIIIWGIELVDGMPKDEGWLKKFRLYARRGNIDLSDYDLDDELDKEFVYKRFVALDGNELDELIPLCVSGVNEEDVELAKESFRGNEGGNAD